MKVIFREIIKGNLPKKGNEEEFSAVKEEKYYFLYHFGNPSKDQIMKFNLSEANSEIAEERCKRIFKSFGYRLDEKTKEWNK
ncbi:hypothetical protein E3V08_01185 [Candidatus Atribacteria bacterium MT.SAG.1]|nr:hypothetical protein E3V08_01185 [Candidatus Atribacteria bacterium MT.SAG.1]